MAEIPEQVGPYRIVSEVGRGGMAVVYLARQPALARDVALKELARVGTTDPALPRRFLLEARVSGSLNHPNVVTVYDFLEHDGVPYIAMEYLERGSLRPFIGRLSLAQAAGVLEGLLAALSHAESMRIVHRDVKPENLLVTAEGGIKIADFGIAKALQQVATEEMLTPAGATVGTPAYMAPEQAMAAEIGPWTDLYQSGVVAFELLSGAVPFESDGSPVAVMMQQISDPLPPLPEGTDPALDAWVRRMAAKAPEDRFPSAAAAWDEFEEIVIRLAGPLWRRGARLADPEPTREQSLPLSPAPFTWHQPAPAEPPPPAEPSPEPTVGWRIAAPSREADGAVTAPIRPSSPPRRRPFIVAIAVLGVLGIAAVAAVLLSGGDGDDTAAPTATVTRTGAATTRFPVGEKPDGVALGAGAAWVAVSGEGRLVRVDQSTGRTVAVDVGENPDSVAFDGDSVWVSVTGADEVVEVSAQARPQVRRHIHVGSRPEGLDASSRAVWVANSGDGSVSQIVKASGKVNTVRGVAAQPVDVAVGAGAVWVAASGDGRVVRIDGGKLTFAGAVQVGPNPRALAIVGHDVWAISAGDGRARSIDGDTNTIDRNVDVGGRPADVAADGRRLWITDGHGDRVVELDPATGTVVGRRTVRGQPLGVAVDARAVWATAFDADVVARLSR